MRRIAAVLAAAACILGTAAQAAEYTITYYNSDGELINTRSLARPSDADISEYVDHYATEDAKTIRVHKLDNGEWESRAATAKTRADELSYTEKAPNVTDEMCRPEYWIGEGSDEPFLSSE